MNSLIEYPSFVGPSRIRTLIVPIGKWHRKEFNEAVKRLRDYDEIRLLDITPIDSSFFTPQGFPNGRLFFSFNTLGYNNELNLFLYDFEPFRKTFIVIGLVNDSSDPDDNLRILKEKYSTVISYNLIYVNEGPETDLPNVFISKIDKLSGLETVMCDIGKNFLQALTSYYASYKHVTLRSPGAIGGNSILKTSITRYDINTTQITSSSSGSSTPPTKRLSSFEMTTNNLKRTASLKLSTSLSSSDSRAQQRSRGRQLKILGNFQLLAGRYLDSLNSFTESIAILHKVKDYLWLGSALDGIAISFLMLSYLEVSFQVPEIVNLICPVEALPPPNSNSTTPRNSVSMSQMQNQMQMQIQSPRNSLNNSNRPANNIDIEKINLPILIKIISNKILYYYELSLTHSSEYAPQVVYSDTLLRTLTFMVSCRKIDSSVQNILKGIVEYYPKAGAEVKTDSNEKSNNESDETIDDSNIYCFSNREIYSFANKLFELQLKDMSIEVQATVYSTMAEVFKLLNYPRKRCFVLRLLLVALLASKEKIIWHSDYHTLLEDIIKLYGIDERNSEVLNNQLQPGWLQIQKKTLQLVLKVAENINDHELTPKFSKLLMTKFSHISTQAEQRSLLIDHLLPNLKDEYISEYWDPFLLRDISIIKLESSDHEQVPVERTFSGHIPSETKVDKELDTHAVINPFKQLKGSKPINRKEEKQMISTFLVGDRGELSLILQNPFLYDISITGLELTPESSSYCELEASNVTVDNPYIVRAQSILTITLPITFKQSTFKDTHKIESVNISIFGLPLREFKIITSENKSCNNSSNFNYKALELKIFPEQPHLELIKTTKLSSNAWMMLDGTKMSFIVKLRNSSLCCSIDQIEISTITNIEKELKTDYWKKLSADDLNIKERQLKWLKESCINIINAPETIKPNEVVEFELELDMTKVPFEFTGFDLLLEYGMNAADKSCVYIKELKIPYEVTVRRTIEVSSMDVIPLNEKISMKNVGVDWVDYLEKTFIEDSNAKVADFVLLLLDFRNSWIDGIVLSVSLDDFSSKDYLVEANHTLRIIIPMKKIDYMNNRFSSKPIPRVFSSRQFVQNMVSNEHEGSLRESYWCREHILNALKCVWKFSHDSSTKGTVHFDKYIDKIDSKMVSTLYKGKVPYQLDVIANKDRVKTGEHLKIDVAVQPTSALTSNINTVFLNLLIFDNRTSKLLPRSNRRILFNGTLSKPLQITKLIRTSFELLPIERGDYQITIALATGKNQQSLLQMNTNTIRFVVE